MSVIVLKRECRGMKLRPLVSMVETRGPGGKQWRRVGASSTTTRSMAMIALASRSHRLLTAIETRIRGCRQGGVERWRPGGGSPLRHASRSQGGRVDAPRMPHREEWSGEGCLTESRVRTKLSTSIERVAPSRGLSSAFLLRTMAGDDAAGGA